MITVATVALCFALPGCKKEEKGPPPLSAASLNAGRAAIRFTSSTAFNGSKSFEVSNTVNTFASNTLMNTTTVRNVKLETTEYSDNAPTRYILINMAANYNSTNIDLSLQSGFPLAFIRLESYSLFGIIRTSKSGTLTITKFTPTEIEGTFRVVMDDGMAIEDGRFAGRF